MNPIAKFVVERSRLAWMLVILTAAMVGWLGSLQVRDMRQKERLEILVTETNRRAIEIMAQTLNGNMMGAVAVLGLIDPAIKLEALGKLSAYNPQVLSTLESIGRSYDADGVFVVAESGIAASSWDNAGRPTTSLNLKFRPYYQMAMQGINNVYAAVSIARGDRALFVSAPVFSETTNATQAIGAVVARTNLLHVDNLLRDKADMALLLSPQGVVFASSRKEWIGHVAGSLSPERLRMIRELKQFGKMFDDKEPAILPVATEPGLTTFESRRFAVAKAAVPWNDPFGDWSLVMLEDLGRTLPLDEQLWTGAGISLAVLLICALILKMLQSSYRQALASQQLEIYAKSQEASARRKDRLAAAMVAMQRTPNLQNLITVFLDEAHGMLGALQGVVYVADGQGQRLQLAGSYACANRPTDIIAIGEGLLGQCAAERRAQLISVDTARFAMVRSGLGETPPAAVLLTPLLLNENLLGVIEIAVLHIPDESDQAQWSELVGLLAMNLEIANRSANTEALSKESPS